MKTKMCTKDRRMEWKCFSKSFQLSKLSNYKGSNYRGSTVKLSRAREIRKPRSKDEIQLLLLEKTGRMQKVLLIKLCYNLLKYYTKEIIIFMAKHAALQYYIYCYYFVQSLLMSEVSIIYMATTQTFFTSLSFLADTNN